MRRAPARRAPAAHKGSPQLGSPMLSPQLGGGEAPTPPGKRPPPHLAFTPKTADCVARWLKRWTRNPLGSARRGSNPLAVDFAPSLRQRWSHATGHMDAGCLTAAGVSRAGARTGLQLPGHGDMQGFDSSSPANRFPDTQLRLNLQ